jgi:ABC-type transport system substrate-binding protein
MRKLVFAWVAALVVYGHVIGNYLMAETPRQDHEFPLRGGTLRLSFPTEFRSLDPAFGFDGSAVPLIKLLFRGLLDYDDGTNLVLDQAAEEIISADQTTYTYRLRSGIRFSNGREVQAADYIYSFERILNPTNGSVGQTYFLDIEGAEAFAAGKTNHVTGLSAPDSRTLVIRLREPRFTFRYILAMCFAVVVPREEVERPGAEFGTRLVGSGPYRVRDWQRDVRWRMERNPYYSLPDGYVDGLEIMIGPDPGVAAMMLVRGEIDRMQAGPAEASRFRKDPALRSWIQAVDTANTDYFFMNTEMPPFDRREVRQAFNYAVDKGRIIQLTGGFGMVANGIVPVSMPWQNPAATHYSHDPNTARHLLAQAGFPNGFKTDLWCILSRPIDIRIASAVQQDLAAIGVDVRLKPVSYPSFQVAVQSRKRVAFGFWGWMQDYPDASNFLDALLRGDRIRDSGCNNSAFYANTEVDRFLALAEKSLSATARVDLYQRAEIQIMADAPWIPILHEQIPMLNHPRLRGAKAHPVWLWRYEKMWLKQ